MSPLIVLSIGIFVYIVLYCAYLYFCKIYLSIKIKLFITAFINYLHKEKDITISNVEANYKVLYSFESIRINTITCIFSTFFFPISYIQGFVLKDYFMDLYNYYYKFIDRNIPDDLTLNQPDHNTTTNKLNYYLYFCLLNYKLQAFTEKLGIALAKEKDEQLNRKDKS